jgi:hypothetical protein
LAHVDPEKFAHVGELLDTWGHSCMAGGDGHEECDEHIRTAGIALMIEDDETPLVFAFCHQHMCEFLERIVYGRMIARIAEPEGNDGNEAK